MALDTSGNPHICYYDTTNEELKYADWDGAQWNIKVVDDNGSVGRYCSIVFDKANRSHMSYVDMGNMSLKYARRSAAFSWLMFLPAIIDNGPP
ncbi:MAG: BNR repeat-containing protein [Desulfobulbaceae bacterium]|nr:BNR repeat-containing protein [Desulfobulbaceae bacterium]